MSRAMSTIQTSIYRILMLNTSLRVFFLETAISVTNLATTTTDSLTYVVTDITKRYFNSTAIVVKVDGAIVTTGYTATNSTGTVVFNASQGAKVITISGSIYPIRIYDEVPKDAHYPYLDIGEFDSTKDDTYSKSGEECFNILHLYTGPKLNSAYSLGNKEIQDISALIINALDGTSLTLTGYTLIDIQWDSDSIEKEDQVRHMAIRFRLWVRSN